jgi:hypothetical protein
MRRSILTVLLLMATVFGAAAQGKIQTKKFKIADFPNKVTKVVLTGNDMVDAAFRQTVSERWSLSPFEFCTPEEFTALRRSELYYFLTFANGPAGPDGEAGLTYLTLVKGGAGAENGLSDMLEVISVPFAPAGAPSVRAFTFLPAFIDLIQAFIPKAIEKDRNAYAGISAMLTPYSKKEPKRVCLSRADLDPRVDETVIGKYAGETLSVADEEAADALFAEERPDMLVGYLIAPLDPSKGADTYKLIFDAGTHELYYFKRDKADADGACGFTADELKKFSRW